VREGLKVSEAILKRRSVRKFKADPVPAELLEKILEAGRWAPSAGNLQPWIFVAVVNRKSLSLLRRFSPGYLGESPAAIVICSNRKLARERGGKLAEEYLVVADCAMAAENMMLMAVELGLASCIIKSFAPEPVKKLLKLPEGVEPELILALGYPAESPQPPPKRELSEIAFLEAYGRPWSVEEAEAEAGKSPGEADPWLSLMAYLVSSALGCLDEPQAYGSFRLLDALSRLLEILETVKPEDKGFLEALRREIEEKKYMVLSDPAGYRRFLVELAGRLVERFEGGG